MHTLDRRVRIQIRELLVSVLSINAALCPENYWVEVRAQYLSAAPLSELHSDDHVNGFTVWEFSLVTEVLDSGDMQRFFGFDKTKNRYICLGCSTAAADSVGITPFSALAREGDGGSLEAWCFVCRQAVPVRRRLRKPKGVPMAQSRV
jgi:hypothetical protein